jgi:hypothetical protein
MSTKFQWKSGKGSFYDGNETVKPLSPCVFADDFLGYKLAKYVANENTTAPWAAVETTGSVALVANTANGIVSAAITNADSAQVAALYFGDQLCFSMKYGLIFETRLTFNVLPTTGTEYVHAVFGLASATNATLDSIATNAWFRVVSDAQTALLWETDDGNTDDDDNAAGITLVAGTYHIYRIDCRDLVNGVKFYVDNALVGTSGDMLTNLTDAEALVQPYFNVMKAKSSANTGTGTMYIDYVRVWQNRS